MSRTALLASLAAATLFTQGCLFIDGSSKHGSPYYGRGSMARIDFDQMVAANTANRIGDSRETVLARFPADHVSLVHSAALADGNDLAVYRVYGREKNRGVRFERYLVFENDHLALLTDDEDLVHHRYNHLDD